jgi:hypothetical protein
VRVTVFFAVIISTFQDNGVLELTSEFQEYANGRDGVR